ncbi:hypothetical protein BN871_BW_00130 [Paenibacillus sp. P22]|nr:hypothetical protein BN871_BW_00130 [Paenibacillus sp. P22]
MACCSAPLAQLILFRNIACFVTFYLHLVDRDVAQIRDVGFLNVVAQHVVDESFHDFVRLAFRVHVLVSPYRVGTGFHVVGRSVYAVKLDRFDGIVQVGESQVADGSGSFADKLLDRAGGILLNVAGKVFGCRSKSVFLERLARSGAGWTVDDDDFLVFAAGVFPVRDFAGEDVDQLLLRQVVDADFLVHDRCHGYNCDLMINQLLSFRCIGIFEFLAGEDVGVADIGLAFGYLRQAGAAAAALDLNRDAGIFGVGHEFLGHLLNQRLHSRRACCQDGTAELGAACCIVRAVVVCFASAGCQRQRKHHRHQDQHRFLHFVLNPLPRTKFVLPHKTYCTSALLKGYLRFVKAIVKLNRRTL